MSHRDIKPANVQIVKCDKCQGTGIVWVIDGYDCVDRDTCGECIGKGYLTEG